MRKSLTAIAAAATLGLAAVAAPQPAQARHGWIAGGIIGGLAAGAIIGSAVANGPYYGYYGPGPYYYGPGPYYYGPGPVYYGPECYWTRQRWSDGFRWHWSRVRVCD
jgi:hypothetical protein